MRHPRLIAMSAGLIGAVAGVTVLLVTAGDGNASGAVLSPTPPPASPVQLQVVLPFQVRSGPARGDLRLPALDSIEPIASSSEEVRTLVPRAAILGPADVARFKPIWAQVTKSPGGEFLAEARYESDTNEDLLITSWTPTGVVDLVLPLSSPVLDIRQTVVAGAQAVLILNAEGVQGKPGHMAYLAAGGVFYFIEANGTDSNNDFVALVTRIAEGLPK